ncbi:MAG: N-acetylmuramic acid 6-phosphate etherase [Acidobacteria bacterium]|nr:N-acetylmuramic acid 6-phosphate etherase [Acidobacteriota bacterium]
MKSRTPPADNRPVSRRANSASSIRALATEQSLLINTSIKALDTLNSIAIVHSIHRQDSTVSQAVAAVLPQIAKVVDAAVKSLRRGGRLIYVGAGTSGRLGVLDAAECPPTFGVSPDKILAVIAGGARALLHAAEAAEDDAALGARDVAAKKVGSRDVVIGLSASGRTPYTVGALRYARSRRAVTVAIACNSDSPLEKIARIAITPLTGPEILSGSTRLKAGLAQKMILQMISTAVMTQLGNVYQNYMVGVRPTNEKLVARACGIISKITGASERSARATLQMAGNDVRTAIVMLRRKLDREKAAHLLAFRAGNLRKII